MNSIFVAKQSNFITVPIYFYVNHYSHDVSFGVSLQKKFVRSKYWELDKTLQGHYKTGLIIYFRIMIDMVPPPGTPVLNMDVIGALKTTKKHPKSETFRLLYTRQ